VRPRWESRNCTLERPAAIAKLEAEQRKRLAAIRKLNGRYAGQPFPKHATEKWNRLSRELHETRELITELRAFQRLPTPNPSGLTTDAARGPR
jgi:hypothetical protein